MTLFLRPFLFFKADGHASVSDSSEPTHYSTEELLTCFKENSAINTVAKHATIAYFQHGDHLDYVGDTLENDTVFTCAVTIATTHDLVLSTLGLEQTCGTSDFFVSVSDGVSVEDWTGCAEMFAPGPDFYSSSNYTKITMSVGGGAVPYGLRLDVLAIVKPEAGKLEHRVVNSNAGYVQTPFWNPFKAVFYPLYVRISTTIIVPEGRDILLSVVHVRLRYVRFFNVYDNSKLDSCFDSLSVYTSMDGESFRRVNRVCGSFRPPVRFFQGKLIRLDFDSTQVYEKPEYKFDVLPTEVIDLTYWNINEGNFSEEETGFRVLYSFHEPALTPDLDTERGEFVCTDSDWPNYARHVTCDMRKNCMDGRDEMDCPGMCENGVGFVIEDTCYLVLTGRSESFTELVGRGEKAFETLKHYHLTRGDLARSCELEGGYLASFNTEPEWQKIMVRLQKWSRSLRLLHIGLRFGPMDRPHYYRYTGHWNDDTIAYLPHVFITPLGPKPFCYVLRQYSVTAWRYPESMSCAGGSQSAFLYLCEMKDKTKSKTLQIPSIQTEITDIPRERFLTLPAVTLLVCGQKHFSHIFSAFDLETKCLVEDSVVYSQETDTWGYPVSSFQWTSLSQSVHLPPSFVCDRGDEGVPYTLVCDYRQDCTDDSDEAFCVFPNCLRLGLFQCTNKQCIQLSARCNHHVDCLDASDEEKCGIQISFTPDQMVYPAIVDFDGTGVPSLRPLKENDNSSCPVTHFMCPTNGFCLPVYVRCNGVNDCPGYEDEAECDDYKCPGLYRCRSRKCKDPDYHCPCVHLSHMCDGWPQCPQHDDEQFCNMTCPEQCVCYGFSFFCNETFEPHHYADLRYVNAKGTGMHPRNFAQNKLLIHLNVVMCSLSNISQMAIQNLRSLDLSDNLLQMIREGDLSQVMKLRNLVLAGNPIRSLFDFSPSVQTIDLKLITLDVSRIQMTYLNASVLSVFNELHTLNFSNTGLDKINAAGFQLTQSLTTLDLRGCYMSNFPTTLFQGLSRLRRVYADTYRLCCHSILPVGSTVTCSSPSDPVSSCENLIGLTFHRIMRIITSVLALIANFISFTFRLIHVRSPSRSLSMFSITMVHLALSDFLMGVHLAVTAAADATFRNSYVMHDVMWRRSTGCITAGVLMVLSHVSSALLLSFLTLQSVCMLYSHDFCLRLGSRAVHIICGTSLLIGIIVATLPFFSWTLHSFVYTSNGLCALLFTSFNGGKTNGWLTESIIMTLNLLISLLLLICFTILWTKKPSQSKLIFETRTVSEKTTRPYRIFEMVFVNSVARFALSLSSLLPLDGVSVSSQTAMAIVVLPLSSAFNPCLYLTTKVLQQRQYERRERLLKMLLARKKNLI